MEFDWDTGNKDKNWITHSVSQEEIEECFFNWSLQFDDVKHSQKEPRRILLGESDRGRLLALVYTVREGRVRAISARPMSRRERELYENKKTKKGASVPK